MKVASSDTKTRKPARRSTTPKVPDAVVYPVFRKGHGEFLCMGNPLQGVNSEVIGWEWQSFITIRMSSLVAVEDGLNGSVWLFAMAFPGGIRVGGVYSEVVKAWTENVFV